MKTKQTTLANRQTFKMMKKQLNKPYDLKDFVLLKKMIIHFDLEWMIENFPEELI